MFFELFPRKKGIEQYRRYLGKRYGTFLCAFEGFIAIRGRVVVELGSCRSFVSGGTPGCMVNDRRFWKPDKPRKWDWGAGLFTRMSAEHLYEYNPQIHSVDISQDAIEISRTITADYGRMITYHHESSEDFLRSFE